MRHDGIRIRDRWDRAARPAPRRSSLLLGTLVGILLVACGGEEAVFVGDPLPGDPRIALITLDVCECNSCRVAVGDPESGEQVFNMVNPPLAQSVVVDSCYDTTMIRITVECGGCPLAVPCTVEATLSLEGEDGGVAMTEVLTDPPGSLPPTVTCVALPGPATSCGVAKSFDLSMKSLINASCPR